MTYKEYKQKSQEEFNALPIFWAFSNEQFKEAMEKRGLTEKDTDKIYKLSGISGGFYLRSDAPIIHEYFDREDNLRELMKDHEFAVSAFLYELGNHEYCYNTYQGDWDVCSCFGNCEYGESKSYVDYLEEIGYGDAAVRAYKEAVKKYYKMCDENDWY